MCEFAHRTRWVAAQGLSLEFSRLGTGRTGSYRQAPSGTIATSSVAVPGLYASARLGKDRRLRTGCRCDSEARHALKCPKGRTTVGELRTAAPSAPRVSWVLVEGAAYQGALKPGKFRPSFVSFHGSPKLSPTSSLPELYRGL
jgi:hypothetical protein